jgi:hypothetical protein
VVDLDTELSVEVEQALGLHLLHLELFHQHPHVRHAVVLDLLLEATLVCLPLRHRHAAPVRPLLQVQRARHARGEQLSRHVHPQVVLDRGRVERDVEPVVAAAFLPPAGGLVERDRFATEEGDRLAV